MNTLTGSEFALLDILVRYGELHRAVEEVARKVKRSELLINGGDVMTIFVETAAFSPCFKAIGY